MATANTDTLDRFELELLGHTVERKLSEGVIAFRVLPSRGHTGQRAAVFAPWVADAVKAWGQLAPSTVFHPGAEITTSGALSVVTGVRTEAFDELGLLLTQLHTSAIAVCPQGMADELEGVADVDPRLRTMPSRWMQALLAARPGAGRRQPGGDPTKLLVVCAERYAPAA